MEWNAVTLGLPWVKTIHLFFPNSCLKILLNRQLTLMPLLPDWSTTNKLLGHGNGQHNHQSSSPNLSQPVLVVRASMADFSKCTFVVGQMIYSALFCCFSPPMEDTSHWISWFTQGTIPIINSWLLSCWAKEQEHCTHQTCTVRKILQLSHDSNWLFLFNDLRQSMMP